jgi:hypothetical protein
MALGFEEGEIFFAKFVSFHEPTVGNYGSRSRATMTRK